MRRQIAQRAVALVAPVLLVLALSACGDSGSSDSEDGSYEYLVITALSGPLAPYGEQIEAGAKAAVEVVNRNGGIMGRQVHLTVEDSGGDPVQVASKVTAALQSDSPPDLILPGGTSTEAVAGVPLANQANVLAAGGAVSTELAEYDRYISGSPEAADASVATLKAIADSGAESIAVLVQDNVSGASALADFEANVDDLGLTITGAEKIDPAAVDATAQLEKLRSGDADALLYSGFGPVAKAVFEGRTKIGWDVPMWSDQTVGAFDFTSLVSPTDLENFTVVVPTYTVEGSELQQSEAIQTAISEIEKAYGGDFDAPIQNAMHTYMSVMLVKYATEEAGSFDAGEVYAARSDLRVENMPLYTGSTSVFQETEGNAPEFKGEDWTATSGSDFEHGFLVP